MRYLEPVMRYKIARRKHHPELLGRMSAGFASLGYRVFWCRPSEGRRRSSIELAIAFPVSCQNVRRTLVRAGLLQAKHLLS
jgi:hypothetical protein